MRRIRMPVPALRVIILTVAVAVVALSVTGWLIRSSTSAPTPTSRGCLAASSLPWPAEGQAAVAVEGIGNLGVHGGQAPVPIASVTKMMTAYVILRDHPLQRGAYGPRVTIDARAAREALSRDESSAPVREGQRFSEREMLELMLIPSGNNIARMLARWDEGSESAFVDKMNEAAAALGMTNTTYTGASGFEATTRSTAADQLKLTREVMKNAVFREIVSTPSVRIDGVPGRIVNTNTLLGKSGVIGGKTGSSTPAGGALMWAAEREIDGQKRLALGVVLGQRADTTPAEGIQAALANSEKLITGIPKALPPSCTKDRTDADTMRAVVG